MGTVAEKVTVAFRYAGVAGATVFATLTAIGSISPEQSDALTSNLHIMIEGLQQALGAGSKIVLIIGPAIGVWLASLGVKSSSISAKISSLVEIANSTAAEADEAKKQIVAATAAFPEVDKVIAPSIANVIPSPKVTS